MTARQTSDDMGKSHGKYDMDRIGLFSEMPYMIGDKYNHPNISLYKCNLFKCMLFKHFNVYNYDLWPVENNIWDLKKSQMYPSTLKTKTGLQDAYFEPQFKRLYENEKWQPPSALFDKKWL